MFDAREMNELLKSEICEVIFTKADGSERNMCCTLVTDILGELPEDYHRTKPWDGDTLIVWDIEADGWRSFKASRVKSFKIIAE